MQRKGTRQNVEITSLTENVSQCWFLKENAAGWSPADKTCQTGGDSKLSARCRVSQPKQLTGDKRTVRSKFA